MQAKIAERFGGSLKILWEILKKTIRLRRLRLMVLSIQMMLLLQINLIFIFQQ